MQKMERISIIAATILAVNFALPLFAADPAVPATPTPTIAVKHQTTCPDMEGNPINKDLFVDYDGNRIYVCCNMCLTDVKEDPAFYIKKLEEKGITLDKTP